MPIQDLDFNRADFTTQTRAANCAWCTRGFGDNCFEVQGDRICAICADRVRQASPRDTRATFLHSILFGSLAAALTGLVYFALFRIADGAWMAFASIGVGYVIGKAMRSGSGGAGGRRYQVMAAVLTYIAVILASSAAILGTADMPIWAYPFLLFAPIVNLFVGRVSMGALEILFAAIGIRWAWMLMAGAPLRITGPHRLRD
jgi:uncharacterized membrane protein